MNYCIENYYFIMEIKNFKNNLNLDNIEEYFEKIKRDYIEESGRYHINIPLQQINEILSTTYSSSAFDKAYNEIMKIWKTDLYPKWKRSSKGREYMRKITK